MSILSYNGVTLPYAYTTVFNQEAVGDSSNTDWMITRFDINVHDLGTATVAGPVVGLISASA